MERKDFYTDPSDPKGNKLKTKELGRRHALEDAIESTRREHPYWGKKK